MNRVTQEEYEKRVLEHSGGKIKVVGRYSTMTSPIELKCNNCNNNFTVNKSSQAVFNSVACPFCSCGNQTIASIQYKLDKTTGGRKYRVISFKTITTTMSLICLKCGHSFDIKPGNMLRNPYCPYCIPKQRTTKYSQEELHAILNEYKDIICCEDSLLNYKKMTTFIYKPTGIYFKNSIYNIKRRKGFPFNQDIKKLIVGFNDIHTTSPEIEKYLLNPNDAFKYLKGTDAKLSFVCPDCRNIFTKKPLELINKNGRLRCPFCGDGFSYPEKFFSNVLSQLKVSFLYQLSSKNSKWCSKYRYDFYLQEQSMIVEINGSQHYFSKGWNDKTLEEAKCIDLLKRQLALDNGIKDYIVINASESNQNFMKESILSSKLAKIFDLSNIDWDACNSFAIKSIAANVYNDYTSGLSKKDLQFKYGLSKSTVNRYINNCQKGRKERSIT